MENPKCNAELPEDRGMSNMKNLPSSETVPKLKTYEKVFHPTKFENDYHKEAKNLGWLAHPNRGKSPTSCFIGVSQ